MSREMREDFAQVLLFAPMENKKQITDAVDSLVRIATAAAEAKYRPVLEELVEALKETKSRTVYYSDYGLGVIIDKALALAAPLVGGGK